jgi:hypothetical protein
VFFLSWGCQEKNVRTTHHDSKESAVLMDVCILPEYGLQIRRIINHEIKERIAFLLIQ